MSRPPLPTDQPNDPGFSSVVHRNIASLTAVREKEEAARGVADRIADTVTGFAGSIWFVVIHAVIYGAWLAINARLLPVLPAWDPFPFVMLAMIASVEAIFLSTFILITQNRMQKLADRRAELDLQVSLLTEHELTRVVRLLDDVARKVGVEVPGRELDEAKRDINPAKVVEAIEQAEVRMEGESKTSPEGLSARTDKERRER